MSEKLCYEDFASLLKKTTTNQQIKAIVDCIDACWNEDGDILEEDGWVKISKLVSEIKK